MARKRPDPQAEQTDQPDRPRARRRPNQEGLRRAPRCSKLSKRTKQRCRAPAVHGTDPPVCRIHAGRSLATIRAQVAVREEVLRWGLSDTHVDPGELLLRLVSQAAARADAYAAELSRIVDEAGGDLRKALTGNQYVTTEAGPVKVGEYIRAMTQLEAAERDRAASFAAKAVSAGLAERQVRLAERQAALAAEFVQAVLADLGLAGTPEATAAINRHLRLIS